MGFRLFAHAIRLVFGNLGQAFRISGILYLMSSGASILVASGLRADPSPERITISVLVTLLEITVGIWIAVAWHRYVLLDEKPDSILPRFNGPRIFVYFGYSLLLGLIMVAAAVVLFIVVGVLQGLHAMILAIPVGIAAVLVLIVAGYRLGVVLPASSVEKSIGIGEAWRATQGANGAILAVAFLTLLCLIVLQIPTIPLILLHLTLALEVWSAVVNWLALMVGVALVTTLYGYYVERRAIP